MTVRVAINGFGRIGRLIMRAIMESQRNDVQVVGINDLGSVEMNAHLLKYDSVHGRFGGEVKVAGNTMDIGRGPMEVFSTYDPEELDWSGVDVVLECTGKFNDGEKAKVHLERGAKKVLISAPAKNVHLQRVLHDELPGPAGQGAERRDRDRERDHDHDPFLHRRPADAGPAAQGSLPRAGGGDVDDPDIDRGRTGSGISFTRT